MFRTCFNEYLYCTDSGMFSLSDKHTYCMSLWIKSVPRCPKCKSTDPNLNSLNRVDCAFFPHAETVVHNVNSRAYSNTYSKGILSYWAYQARRRTEAEKQCLTSTMNRNRNCTTRLLCWLQLWLQNGPGGGPSDTCSPDTCVRPVFTLRCTKVTAKGFSLEHICVSASGWFQLCSSHRGPVWIHCICPAPARFTLCDRHYKSEDAAQTAMWVA